MTNKEIVKIENLAPDVIFQQDKAIIDMQISTAKAYPRNIKRATENAIAIVTLDKETASTCTYSVPRAGKVITGASVHLAKILAQSWGNLRIEAKVILIESKHITSQAIAFDLENNLAIKVEVKRSIIGKKGRFNDDLITVTGNAANAIALRNAILSVIPRGISDKVYNSAKKMITGDISDETKLISKRKQVVDALKDTYNVTEKEILDTIGKVAINHITADDIVVLIGIGQAIKDGDMSIENAFKSNKKTENIDKINDNKEIERIKNFIENAKSEKELKEVSEISEKYKLQEIYLIKLGELQNFGTKKETKKGKEQTNGNSKMQM